MTIHSVIAVMLVVAWLEYLACLIGYHTWSRGDWRRSLMGRYLMAFIASLTAVLTIAASSLILGPLPDWVRVASWGVIILTGFLLLRSLWHFRYRPSLRKKDYLHDTSPR
jgi:hypothetical protein